SYRPSASDILRPSSRGAERGGIPCFSSPGSLAALGMTARAPCLRGIPLHSRQKSKFPVTDRPSDSYFGKEALMATEFLTVSASVSPEPLSPESAAKEVARATAPGGEARLIILAGGDGVRLRSVTRALEGDDRPKQFSTLVGKEPLLVQTVRRA